MQLAHTILNPIKRVRLFVLVLAALTINQSIAQARNQVPFRAVYDLELQTIVDLPFAHITSTGEARATHLGRVMTQSVEEVVNLFTGEGVATHQFTAANGDIILVDFAFVAIPITETLFVVTGVWEISDGTGRFAGASGSGSYEGEVEFSTPDSAAGHFVMSGTISSPGSLK